MHGEEIKSGHFFFFSVLLGLPSSFAETVFVTKSLSVLWAKPRAKRLCLRILWTQPILLGRQG